MTPRQVHEEFSKVRTRGHVWKAIDTCGLKVLAEIGVFRGDNLAILARSRASEIWGIDHWIADNNNLAENDSNSDQKTLDTYYKSVMSKFSRDVRVNICRERSLAASRLFDNNYFDYIYIDAAHDYESVRLDLCRWWKKLKSGGVIGGHDYCERAMRTVRYGVIEAVDYFLHHHNLSKNDLIITQEVKFKSFFIVKP